MKFIYLKRESTNGIINSILRGKLATDLGEVVLVQSDSMRPHSTVVFLPHNCALIITTIEHSGYGTWFKLSVFWFLRQFELLFNKLVGQN